MRTLPIRVLLLGVAGASLLLPLIALLSLWSFDAVLVRQTERELNAQGALVAAYYQGTWVKERDLPLGNPRDKAQSESAFTPWSSRLEDLDQFAFPMPEPLPKRPEGALKPITPELQALSQILKNAQVFNLSGIRVLDAAGCAVASSRGQLGDCFNVLPEVESALSGHASSVLRKRSSDEPAPTLASIRRRGDLRVFVALPVHNESQVVGAVLLSRTAESGLEWLFKQRQDLFYGGLFVLTLAVCVSFGFSLLITKPLKQMTAQLTEPGATVSGLSSVQAPKEIHSLGVALDERSKQLAEKSRYVAEFAANVSHELKTPLTSIRGAVELLSAAKMDDAQRARFLANIDAAADRTSRLVTRLLELARLEARTSPNDEDPVLLEDWAKGLSSRYGSGVTLRLKSGGGIRYPSAALESVVGNLVDNALRYRKEQPVELTFDHAPAPSGPGRMLHIRVKDDGPGVREEDKKRLFERFFTTERDQGGTGLGLAIVLATAESRGGTATIKSDETGTQIDVWM